MTPKIGALFERAEMQQGYFTSKQAAAVGYLLGSQAHHVKMGNWDRVERGIYRLTRFPRSDEEQLVIYSLWSRNRAGRPEGVYSHLTALSIHDLSDANPAKLHMTIPTTFRRTAKVPKVLELHRADLVPGEIEQRRGFAVVRPFKAIAQLAADEEVSREIVEQALVEGRERGLITLRDISDVLRTATPAGWFAELLLQQQH
jgi:hypothetical protein